MTLKQQVTQDLERLDEAKLAALYGEFAEEDHALAEAGMVNYAAGLDGEDAA
ncbi:MAG: hypothetical protein M3Y13_11475 [Armatimonadota bacterium]|nr:hypothetical protein [Armatimonadota bacterium]